MKKNLKGRLYDGVSPGRVVLTGEHSVVYGEPALVGSIDLKIGVNVGKGEIKEDLEKNSYFKLFLGVFSEEFGVDVGSLCFEVGGDLPQKVGLSSSSALACALFAALAEWYGSELTRDKLFELVLKAERRIYAVSGMDQAAVVYGGLFRFQKRDGELLREVVDAGLFGDRELVLIDSGLPEESTKEMVGLVKSKYEAGDSGTRKVILEMGEISERFLKELEKGVVAVELVRENQRLLDELGVVGERARRMVGEVERIGGVAKICGAGGVKSGSGVMMAFCDDNERLRDLIARMGWDSYLVKLGGGL